MPGFSSNCVRWVFALRQIYRDGKSGRPPEAQMLELLATADLSAAGVGL